MPSRALSFGAVAEAYERFRPGYPAELFDMVMAYAGQPVGTALEVGAGTGKATRLFARGGVTVTATEPDAAMLTELRKHVPSNVETVIAVAVLAFLSAARAWWPRLPGPLAAVLVRTRDFLPGFTGSATKPQYGGRPGVPGAHRRAAGRGSPVQPGVTRSRITTTGQVAWCTQCWPTEPSRAPANPPWPRLPTTSSSAPAEASSSARAALPSTTAGLIVAGSSGPATSAMAAATTCAAIPS